MSNTFLTKLTTAKTVTLASLFLMAMSVANASANSVIDDFNHQSQNNLGKPRVFISDTTAGGNTQTQATVTNGVLHLKGEILPPRGQPGWSSTVLPIAAMGQVKDASQFTGIKLKIKITQGNVSVSANSSDVTNYDYHSAPVLVKSDGEFHQVSIPFDSLKRIWSEQTTLNTKTLNSLSIVAYSPQKASFDIELDEVAFY